MTVTVRSVSVELGGQRLVDDVSCDVPAGTTLGVVGPNGSGKSTLLRTIYRELAPTCGAVLVDGTDVTARALLDHARRVAALAQHDGLDLDFTVAEVVGLGRHPHPRDDTADRAAVAAALAETEVAHLAERSVLTLSGGERQRVMLARALAQATPVLVLDEPTNHLDLRHQLRVVARIATSPRTVVVALHDLNLAAALCDRLVVMDAGRVVAAGEPDNVLQPELVETVYGIRPLLVDHPETGRPQLLFSPDVHPAPDERHHHAQPQPS
ncbi:ABC transporter ATP-binding protein [Luteipulveratus halotolerans]|uniref:ABC transporter ATP-binding protein n=1 Tax=Luteipulveratus halotolerans TaxID=1631356 RepID=A0A0L6CMF7_9MICO|nr:ABC transporter ATP-binding protein [Luteipulveratus halotolerans]KNX38927.1 ABC transporter ATP-binding protein [Luteipulveratus halotolerans]